MARKSKQQDRSYLCKNPVLIALSGPDETWLPVAEFEHYFVSNFGRVCGVDRITPHNKIHRGRVLKPGTLASGHKYVVFYGGHHRQVHRLLLTAFVGPCPDGHEGLHWDDDASNNVLTNLRWGTRSANLVDALRNGKKPVGIHAAHAKLTDDAVRYIRANPDRSLHGLGIQFGVTANAIKQVRFGITWKHVA